MNSNSKNQTEVACIVCGGKFVYERSALSTPGRLRRFCGPKCRRQRLNQLGRSYRPPRRKLCECAGCHGQFLARTDKQLFCSLPSCRKQCKADAASRRRAAKRGAGSVRFTRRSIFERDGWKCWICEKPVDKSGADKDLRPSLDHVIPLAKGGQHHPDNCRCAHWVCNSKRVTLPPRGFSFPLLFSFDPPHIDVATLDRRRRWRAEKQKRREAISHA